jgi:two-component system, NarL family, nitrate/nitrite response regulator NarL
MGVLRCGVVLDLQNTGKFAMSGVFVVGNQLSRAGLKSLLAGSDFSPIGETRTLAEAHRVLIETLAENGPHILLTEIQAHLSDEEEDWLRAIRHARPTIKMAIISDALSLAQLSQQCGIEIDGYLLTETLDVALKYSLHLIESGQRIFPPGSALAASASLSASGGAWAQMSHLSARELLVLQLLIAGSANKDIARDLAISDATVKLHMKALLRKLSVQNRTQAALWGIEHGVPNPATAAIAWA